MTHASRLRHSTVPALLLLSCLVPRVADAQQPSAPLRPRIGLALGGGSARGFAHVGVLRWLEEHRIPTDVIAGTSMGGLIGGAYASGLSPDAIETTLAAIDWTLMFSSTDFPFRTVRRKRDSRAYPAYIEFGLKGGLTSQPSLNSGQQVDLLLQRFVAPYFDMATFDDLPTPFRCVAFDLRTASRSVLDRGSLARALRATMSLPAVFPPVSLDGQVLVDGGMVDNVPADVAREMGATVVIAVNVGDLSDPAGIAPSMLGVASSTVDAMMRANTLRGMASADVVINVPLTGYGSLDWRRYRDLIAEGYAAAEASGDTLRRYTVDETAWRAWQDARAARVRRTLPVPTFVELRGAEAIDQPEMRRALAAHLGQPIDIAALEETVTDLGGTGLYESLVWQVVERGGEAGLLLEATPKSYGPPFLFIGVSLEDATSNTFRFGLGGRYLAFDVAGRQSELRLDATIGSDAFAGASLYRPFGRTPFFVEPGAQVGTETVRVADEGQTLATYQVDGVEVRVDAGVNLGRFNEVRAGWRWAYVDATVDVGSPLLPELDGPQSEVHLTWTHDTQDDPVVASRGLHAVAALRHYLQSPFADLLPDAGGNRVTQATAVGSWVRSFDRGARNRLFVNGGAGTSFDGDPLPTEQFQLGGPFRLSALDAGARSGAHFLMATAGYLRQVARLPDFVGGPVLLGGWIEEGSAFDSLATAQFDTNVTVGLVTPTLVGPVFAGASVGFDGSRRFYVGIGRFFN